MALVVAVPVGFGLVRWAYAPIDPGATAPDSPTAAGDETSIGSAIAAAPFELDHFDDRLWRRTAEPVDVATAEAAKTAAPARIPVVLLGITSRGSVFAADLYDQKADAIIVAEAGSRVGPYVVSAIGATFVELKDRSGKALRLDLDLGEDAGEGTS